MATKFQKDVKRIINESSAACADKIVCHGDGTVSVKRSFFYRHGRTAFGWANDVSLVLTENDFDHKVVEVKDDQRAWPADSYFVVRIGMIPPCSDCESNPCVCA